MGTRSFTVSIQKDTALIFGSMNSVPPMAIRAPKIAIGWFLRASVNPMAIFIMNGISASSKFSKRGGITTNMFTITISPAMPMLNTGIMRVLITRCLASRACSIISASWSRAGARLPVSSPTCTMLIKSGPNTSECLPNAKERVPPSSTVFPTSPMIRCMTWFLLSDWSMSRVCCRGAPLATMVAIWRVNRIRSPSLTL